MSTHSSIHSESDGKSTKSLLKQLTRYFQLLSLTQLQHDAQILEENDTNHNNQHMTKDTTSTSQKC